jgi:hypothetical protein
MADESFLDCSTLSISYQSNGLANISMTVYSKVGTGAPYSPGGPGLELTAGGIHFKGYILEQSLAPASETDYNEYKVTAVAIGKRV